MESNATYNEAKAVATESIKSIEDTGYGCGSSFITIKWGKFCRDMKKAGLVRRDGYYGWILETDEPVQGTLEQEGYNLAFARSLNQLDDSIYAFAHTRLN